MKKVDKPKMDQRVIFLDDFPNKHHPLAKWMIARKLPVSELALLLRISPSSVYRWLDGSRSIPNNMMWELHKLSKGRAGQAALDMTELIKWQVQKKRARG